MQLSSKEKSKTSAQVKSKQRNSKFKHKLNHTYQCYVQIYCREKRNDTVDRNTGKADDHRID